MTCVHTITNLLLTSYIVFPTVLPRRLVSLRHELDQHLFTVKVAGTGATDLFWALGWVLSVSINSHWHLWQIILCIFGWSMQTFVSKFHHSPISPSVTFVGHLSWLSVLVDLSLNAKCIHSWSLSTCVVWVRLVRTSSGRHWADQCQTHVMTCVSYLVLTHYRIVFGGCWISILICSNNWAVSHVFIFCWFWFLFLGFHHGNVNQGGYSWRYNCPTTTEKPQKFTWSHLLWGQHFLFMLNLKNKNSWKVSVLNSMLDANLEKMVRFHPIKKKRGTCHLRTYDAGAAAINCEHCVPIPSLQWLVVLSSLF